MTPPEQQQSTSVSRSSSSAEVETTPTPATTIIQHHRFVPRGAASLESDAPGWGSPGSSVDDVDVGKKIDGENVQEDQEQPQGGSGPICWKCKGEGHKRTITNARRHRHDSQQQQPPKPKVTCPVCKGKGRLPPRAKNNKKQDEMKRGTPYYGVIKRARPNPPGFVPSGPMAYALLLQQKNQHQSQNNDRWIKLVNDADNGIRDGIVDILDTDNDDKHSYNYPNWLPEHPNEQFVKLIGQYRILQRVGSHKWTTDDLVTSYVATLQVPHILLQQQLQQHATTNNANEEQQIQSSTSTTSTFRYMDLGCGNGSVLQMVVWGILKNIMMNDNDASSDTNTKLEATGIEARLEAVQLARRSLEFNVGPGHTTTSSTATATTNSTCSSCSCNVQVLHADFRDLELDTDRKFDLITGTPPYFRVDFTFKKKKKKNENNDSNNNKTNKTNNNTIVVDKAIIRQGGMPSAVQSAPARCEFRGGIEEYCQTAARYLKPGSGLFVVCENYLNHQRAIEAASDAGFRIIKRLDVEGCVGRGTLFVVYVMKLLKTKKTNDDDNNNSNKNGDDAATVVETLTVRELSGKWTEQYVKSVFATMSIPGPL